VARLSGQLGAVYVKVAGVFTKVADIYDWQFTANTTMLACSIKMDTIERFTASHGSGVKFTAKRRTEGVSVLPFYVADSANNGTQTTWRLDLIDNDNTFTQITVNGYAEQSTSNAPADGSDETFTLQIDDTWAYTN
jgi:hypothetical protein